MSLDLGAGPLRPAIGHAGPAAPQTPALSQGDAALLSARQMVSATFAHVYGEGGAQAENAFADAVHRDGLAPALHTLGTRPDAFGNVVGDGARSAERLSGGLGAAIDIGAYAERAHAAAGEASSALSGAITARGVVTWADGQAARASDGRAPLGAASAATREVGDGLTQRPPDVLDRILDYLYWINESRLGSWAIGAASLNPVLDRILDVIDVALSIRRVSQPEHRTDPEVWTNLVTTGIGVAIPEIGDLLEAELNDVIRGGPAAAVHAMERIGPVLRGLGYDPAGWLEEQARAVPGLIDQTVTSVTETVADGLSDIGKHDRLYVPDWMEEGAAEAAASMRSAGAVVRQGARAVSGEISQALRNMATAARSEGRAAAPRAVTPGRERTVARERAPEVGAVRGVANNGLPAVALNRRGWHTLPASEAQNFIEAEATTVHRKIYRIIEDPARAERGYWSYELPASMTEWRSDYAVLQEWNRNGLYVEMDPGEQGIRAWAGRAAEQTIRDENRNPTGWIQRGGHDQIYIPRDTWDDLRARGIRASPPHSTGWSY